MDIQGYYDFHTHTSFREGTLLPSELVQRNVEIGCKGIAITDHADISNLSEAIDNIKRFVDHHGQRWGVDILIGVELTHVPPAKIESLTQQARTLGAQWVVVHGQSLFEPVAEGTNRAAIEAGVNLLAHPGLLKVEDADLAQQLGVYLELSLRPGHNLGNGIVTGCARDTGAKLLLNSDTHKSVDLMDGHKRKMVARGIGLSEEEIEMIWNNGRAVFQSICK